MAESGFSGAFNAIPKSKFKTAATKERSQFSRCTAVDGDYTAKLTNVKRDKTDKGPYVSFNFVIMSGQYKGQTPSEFHGLFASGKRTLEGALAGLHWYLQDFGYETDEHWGAQEFEEAFKELDELQPVCKINIKNNGQFQNVRLVELLDETTVETATDPVSDDSTNEDDTEVAVSVTDEDYAELENLYNTEEFTALVAHAQNLGSQLDPDDFPESWESYWLALIEEIVG